MCLCVYKNVHALVHVHADAHWQTHIFLHTHEHTLREREVYALRCAPHQMEKFVIPSTQYASSLGNQPGVPLWICPSLDPNYIRDNK